MIKRTNKIVAIMVAATSIISIIPAAAQTDETEIKKLQDSSGEITNAISFKDGKYIYEGSKSDKEYGVYYNNGTSEVKLDDIDSLDGYTKYGESNVSIGDGNDEDNINLEDGTIKNDNTRDDALDATKSKIQSKLSRTNKYGNNTNITDFNEISNNKFNDQQWYSYVATGNKDYYQEVSDSSTDDQDTTRIEFKTKIQVEITSFYSDIEIAGKTFQPKWGSNLPESLAKKIKSASKKNELGDYKVVSVNVEKGADDNSGKVTVVLGTNEELTEVPDGFFKFGGNNPENYQMTFKILTDSNTNNSTTTSAAVNTNTDTNTSTNTNNDTSNKAKITLTINNFWGDIKIAGKEFQPNYYLNGSTDIMANLVTEINNSSFDGYKLESASVENGQVIAVFTTTDKLNKLPHQFTTGLSYCNDYSGGSLSSVQVENIEDSVDQNTSTDAKTKITLGINNFYGKIIIAGKEFQPNYWLNGSTDIMANLVTEINNSSFDDYALESATLDNGVVTVSFTTSEELTELPDGFTTLGCGNYSLNGSASIKFEQITSDENINNTDEEDDEETVNDDASTTSAAVSTTTTTTGSAVSTDDTSNDSEQVKYYGYTDGKGNYIDCSKVANISVYDGKDVVKIDNFNEKKVKNGKTIIVGLPTLEKTLGQDENYIYSLISVPVTGYCQENGDEEDDETMLYYVQKISKVKSSKDGGAYIPSKVESYQLNNNVGWSGGDNWSYMAAYNLLAGDDSSTQIRIIDGNIYVAHEITIDSIKDGKDNANSQGSNHNENNSSEIKVEFAKMKLQKAGKITPVTTDGKKDNSRSMIAEPVVAEDSANSTKMDSWTFDSNGNVWAIYHGKIKKSAQANEFQDMYKVDGSIDKLDVYDDNNLIAWSSDDDDNIYVTNKEGETATNVVVKTGWHKSEDGTWHLYDAAGNERKGWINFGSCWYYFNDQGVMKTGWLKDNGKWYYLADSGVMKTGWNKIDEKWYYLDQSGVRQENTVIDGYSLDADGIWIK